MLLQRIHDTRQAITQSWIYKIDFQTQLTKSWCRTVFWHAKTFNSLPNNKILDQSILKDFADDKINVTYVKNFVMERVENVGKGENAGYQHFSFSHNIFKGLL